MDAEFENLKNKERNHLDGIIKWMKDASIIDGVNITEEQVKKEFNNTKEPIELDNFKQTLKKLADDSKSNVDDIFTKLSAVGSIIEDAFDKLKKDGNNNVDKIIEWMKQTNLIDSEKESEAKARHLLLAHVEDEKDVQLQNFKEAVNKLLEEKTGAIDGAVETTSNQVAGTVQGVANILMQEAPRIVNAFSAAGTAFAEAMRK